MSNIMYNENDMYGGAAEDSTKDLYLTFEIDGENYAIEVSNIIEIIPVQNITFVPEVPNYVKGIINLRGDIIPVIDVRTKFMKPEIPYTQSTCIVVITYQEYDLGLIVDRVIGTLTITEENTSPPPSAKLRFSNQFIRSIGKNGDQVNLMLDLDKLVF